MLRIGYVGIIRPLFKGDSPQAAQRSLERLKDLGKEHDFEVVTANVSGNDKHVATGQDIPPFAVSNLGAAEQAAKQLKDEQLDFLFIQHTTFTTGDLLVPLLHAAKRVGVWALPESAADRGEGGPLPLNALCGLNMTLSFLDHPEVAKKEPVKWFYGEATSKWFLERLEPTLTALKGLKALETSRILQVGGTAPSFFGIEEFPSLKGVTVETKELAELFDRVAGVSENEAQSLANDWGKKEKLNAPKEHLVNAARVELGLRSLAEEGDYNALAIRCWPELPDACGGMACASVGRLGDTNIPTACEGDVMGALSMRVLGGMSGEPTILMDLSDVDLADDTLQFWHCGNAPLEWAAGGNSRLTTHFNRDGVGVVRDMVLRPGRATGFRLLSQGKEALVMAGTFTQPEKAGFDGVRGWLGDLSWNGADMNAQTFVANVLDYRLPHHFAFGAGEMMEALNELSGWVGATVLEARPERKTL